LGSGEIWSKEIPQIFFLKIIQSLCLNTFLNQLWKKNMEENAKKKQKIEEKQHNNNIIRHELITIYENYLNKNEADELFKKCEKLDLVIRPEILMFGKICHQNRNVGFFSNEEDIEGYKYSRQIAEAKEMPLFLVQLLERINEEYSTKFNGILVNEYTTGNDTIGVHSDNEKELPKDGRVFAISLGASRILRFKK